MLKKNIGEDLKFKFTTFTDYEFKQDIMKFYEDSLIEEILKKSLLKKEDQDKSNLLEIFSYENMKKYNSWLECRLKLPNE